jgi:formylglycine-generating enzyme required for sulfatase activity
LGKYEVTQAQYEAVMTGNTYGISATPSNWPNNPNRPVEKVSIWDIRNFLTLLNEAESENLEPGWVYDLPTEAQWEYACRAGSTTVYSWGDEKISDKANHENNETVNVGLYERYAWECLGMGCGLV